MQSLQYVNRQMITNWLTYRGLVVLGLVLIVGGCAWFGPSRPPETLAETGFAVQGKLGVRQGDEGFSSNFSWHQTADGFDIELWGPLGQGRTRMQGEANGSVTITTSRGEVYEEPDTTEAMRRWFGMAVPLDALQHWIRGLPAPAHPISAEQRDAANQLVSLEQLDWQLQFSAYRPPDRADGLPDDAIRALPGRLVATHEDIRVTLVPGQWVVSGDMR